MATYTYRYNPIEGTFDIAVDETSFHVKAPVATYNDLPVTGNSENDMRFTSDTDDAYVWSIAAASGSLSDWEQMPILSNLKMDDIADGTTYGKVKLADLSGGQVKQVRAVSGAADVAGDDIKTAVDNEHTHANKSLLDTYTQTETDIADAISKEHEHSNKSELDLVTDGDHDVVSSGNPHSVSKSDVGLGSVPNLDTTDAVNNEHTHSNKALLDTYDQTNADISSAVTNDHTHANKAQLDLLTDGDHDVRTDNPHAVTKAQVGLDTGSIDFIIDGGGSAITTGPKGWLRIPFACTLTGWKLTADQAGDIVIDVWKDTYANYPPDNADTITNGHEPALTSAAKAEDTDISDWGSTSVSAGDYLKFNVDSVATVTRILLTLTITKT